MHIGVWDQLQCAGRLYNLQSKSIYSRRPRPRNSQVTFLLFCLYSISYKRVLNSSLFLVNKWQSSTFLLQISRYETSSQKWLSPIVFWMESSTQYPLNTYWYCDCLNYKLRPGDDIQPFSVEISVFLFYSVSKPRGHSLRGATCPQWFLTCINTYISPFNKKRVSTHGQQRLSMQQIFFK